MSLSTKCVDFGKEGHNLCLLWKSIRNADTVASELLLMLSACKLKAFPRVSKAKPEINIQIVCDVFVFVCVLGVNKTG